MDRQVDELTREELEAALLRFKTPRRRDIHWENDSEGAHYSNPGCCKFGPQERCKNQVRFETGTPKEELLFRDGTCTACGARYHCARCGIGTGMVGHRCRLDLPPPPKTNNRWGHVEFPS